jgi:hypothetical protein
MYLTPIWSAKHVHIPSSKIMEIPHQHFHGQTKENYEELCPDKNMLLFTVHLMMFFVSQTTYSVDVEGRGRNLSQVQSQSSLKGLRN